MNVQSYPMLPPAYSPPQQPNLTINLPSLQQPASNPTFLITSQQQQQQQEEPKIIKETPKPITMVMVGKEPVRMTCNNCQGDVITKVEKKMKSKAICLSFLLCFVLLCCLPRCLDSMKVFHHTCPNCRGYIGKFEE